MFFNFPHAPPSSIFAHCGAPEILPEPGDCLKNWLNGKCQNASRNHLSSKEAHNNSKDTHENLRITFGSNHIKLLLLAFAVYLIQSALAGLPACRAVRCCSSAPKGHLYLVAPWPLAALRKKHFLFGPSFVEKGALFEKCNWLSRTKLLYS